MSKYMTQEEANAFFDSAVKKLGHSFLVSHTMLADASGIPLREAYNLFLNWSTKWEENEQQHYNTNYV